MRIFVPSYKRYDKIVTYFTLDKQCTYVVRESEKELYIKNGIEEKDILAVKDENINSFPKVRQFIINYGRSINEDVIVQCDDDISGFKYLYDAHIKDMPKENILPELERIAQIIYDLKLGFGSFPMTIDVRKYNKPFQFKGLIGGICFYNLKCLKGQYDENLSYKCDIDFQMQELLKNRIILQTYYFTFVGKYDTNKGGNTDDKTKKRQLQNIDYLKNKWGKYLKFHIDKNTMNVEVKR